MVFFKSILEAVGGSITNLSILFVFVDIFHSRSFVRFEKIFAIRMKIPLKEKVNKTFNLFSGSFLEVFKLFRCFLLFANNRLLV